MRIGAERARAEESLRGGAGRWPRALGLAAFAVVVILPPLAVLLDGPGVPWREALALALPLGRRFPLLARSVLLALAVSLSGAIIGALAALRVWPWRRAGAKRLRWLIVALLAVPPYVHALAWSSVTAGLQDLLGLRGAPSPLFSGWAACAWVQMMGLLPAAVGLALLGLGCVSPALIEAARVLGPDDAALRRVILPLAAPYLLAGAGLLFSQSLLDYGVPALFDVNVYALEPFAEFSASAAPLRSLLASAPQMVLCGVVIALSQGKLRGAAMRPAWRQQPWAAPPRWGRGWRLAQDGALLLLLLHAAAPAAALLASLRGGAAPLAAVRQARGEIAYTLLIAALAGLLCLPLALAAADALAGGGRGQRLCWALVAAPLAIPGALVGVGLISLWRRLSPGLVYGSAAMPVLASLARFAPWAALVMLAHRRRLDPALWDAARVMPVSEARRVARVYAPLLAPGLLAAGALAAALSTGELAATLIVAPPGRATLVMRVFNYLHYGASGEVAALCLVLALLAAGGGLLAAAALALWSRLAGGGERP